MLVGCSQVLDLDKDYTLGNATPSTGGDGGTGAAGGGVGGNGVGGGPPAGVCGDGLLAGGEECDDGDDTNPADGCHDCLVADGFTCVGEPSVCSSIAPIVVTNGSDLNRTFAASAYDGSIASMECELLAVVAPAGALVKRVEVVLGVDSTWVGDLVFKIVSPSNTTLSLLSRPGALEAADDGTGGTGEGSNLIPSHPVTFRDDGPHDA